jgi:hypothetical protein
MVLVDPLQGMNRSSFVDENFVRFRDGCQQRRGISSHLGVPELNVKPVIEVSLTLVPFSAVVTAGKRSNG